SQQIKLLESEIGVQLFNREPRGVTLTDAGITFLEHARALTEGAKAAVRETVERSSGSIGTVRIAAINSAMFNTMPVVLKCLRDSFAGLNVSVSEMGSQAQIKALLHKEVDLGLMSQPAPTPGLRIDKIYTEKLCVA